MILADGGLTFEIAVERLVDLLPLILVTVVMVAVLEVGIYLLLKKVLRSKYTLPYTLVAPAALALLLFTVYPFIYNIRLAFSDLKISTISCYIPNNDITNRPCALAQAAPNKDVKLTIDYPVRENRQEVSAFITDLSSGQEVYVSDKKAKIDNYITTPANKVVINEDGSFGRTCSPLDKACNATFDEYKERFLANQDERDWWPVEVDGKKGYIPDWIHRASADAPIYAGATGTATLTLTDGVYALADDQTDQTVLMTKGQEVRPRAAGVPPTVWYHVQLNDGTAGWIEKGTEDNPVVVESQSFFPAEDAVLYQATSTGSEEVGTVTAEQETVLRQDITLTWYQVLLRAPDVDDVTGWIYVPAVNEVKTITTFLAESDTPLYEEVDETGNPVGDSIAEVKAGSELIQLVRDDTRSESTIWYQVETLDGTTGWLVTNPINQSEVEVLTFGDDVVLYEDFGSATEIGTLPADQRARLVERNSSADQHWTQILTSDGVQGWTTTEGTITRNFTVNPKLEAENGVSLYAQPGALGGEVGTVPVGQRLNVIDANPTQFKRTHVVLLSAEGTPIRGDDTGKIVEPGDEGYATAFLLDGWLDNEPQKVATTERDPVLYSFDYGWDNFKRVFVKTDAKTGDVQGWGRLLLTQNSTFPRMMRTTLAWTSLNVLFHLIFGMILALLLNRPGMKFRGIYRAILILPWAIPQTIIALAWKGEFHSTYGFVNILLKDIGLEPVNWLFSATPAFAAVTFVNIWLGIPFYMVTLLGGLQSIAGEYYEAAEIDGANGFQRFRHVTVPLIRPVAVPVLTLDVIWTFNNFNVIYLISEGGPNESTNILVTALYNAAFGSNGAFQLGFAAAFSLVIFAVLFIFASVWVTSSGALKGVYES